MLMKYEVIKKIIDDWDPIDLSYFAPEDEYDPISKKIAEIILKISSEKLLGNIIFELFIESFGVNTFTKSLQECEIIAHKLLSDHTS